MPPASGLHRNSAVSATSCAVIAVNGGVTGQTYGFTVAGKAFGSVTGIAKMTGLTGGKGDDRLGGVYTLGSQYATIAGGDGTDTAVVDLSDDTAGFSCGLNNRRSITKRSATL